MKFYCFILNDQKQSSYANESLHILIYEYVSSQNCKSSYDINLKFTKKKLKNSFLSFNNSNSLKNSFKNVSHFFFDLYDFYKCFFKILSIFISKDFKFLMVYINDQ